MKKYTKVRPLSSEIQRFLKESVPENFYFLALLRKNWEQIIGKALAMHSQPFSIRSRVLVINVDDPIWLQELNLHKDEIKGEILQFFNNKKYETLFDSIHFRVGETSHIEEREKKFSKNIDPKILKKIEETVKNVTDTELKEALRHYFIESCSKVITKEEL